MCGTGRVLAIGLMGVLLASAPRRVFAQETPPQTPPETQKQPTAEQERIKRYCASLSETKRRQTEMCKTPAEQREDEYQKRQKEAEEKEKSKNSSFLKWIHTDGLWLPGNARAGLYGLAGVHVAVANIG